MNVLSKEKLPYPYLRMTILQLPSAKELATSKHSIRKCIESIFSLNERTALGVDSGRWFCKERRHFQR